MMIPSLRPLLFLLLVVLLPVLVLVPVLILAEQNPGVGPAPAAEPVRSSRTPSAAGAGGAPGLALRKIFRFEGSTLSAGEVRARGHCDVSVSIAARGDSASGTERDCRARRFRSASAVEIGRILGPPPRSPGWRLGLHQIAAMRPIYELVERRCDLDADGEITSGDLRLGGDILADLVTPTGREALQLDAAPEGDPDGRLSDEDLAIIGKGAAGETSACEVAVTKTRRLRDRDRDGVLRIACLGDSNSCYGKPFRCGPIRSLCALLQELSPELASAEGELLPSEFISYAWSGTTVCDNPDSSIQFGARAQYQEARSRVDPGATDAVVIAFGTNDYGVLDKRPQEIAQCYEDIVRAADADGIPAWIAFTPPIAAWPGLNPELLRELARRNEHARETNRALLATFRVDSLVDFSSGFESLDLFVLEDPLHLNDDGQRLRAQRVLEVLR